MRASPAAGARPYDGSDAEVPALDQHGPIAIIGSVQFLVVPPPAAFHVVITITTASPDVPPNPAVCVPVLVTFLLSPAEESPPVVSLASTKLE